MQIVWKLLSKLTGKNSTYTSKETVLAQTQEKRLLPVGREEFNEWSARIISGTLLPADHESMRFALANMLIHLSPTECAKDDAYFIASLRKFAINQVADTVRCEIRDAVKARLAQNEVIKAQNPTLTVEEVESLKTDIGSAHLKLVDNPLAASIANKAEQANVTSKETELRAETMKAAINKAKDSV